MTIDQLMMHLPRNLRIGCRQARHATGIVYYTTDTPAILLQRLKDKRLHRVETTSAYLARKLGKKYLVHIIS